MLFSLFHYFFPIKWHTLPANLLVRSLHLQGGRWEVCAMWGMVVVGDQKDTRQTHNNVCKLNFYLVSIPAGF